MEMNTIEKREDVYMKSLEITIRNAIGLHALPVVLFVQTAQKYKSNVKVSYGNKTANGKDLLEMLNLNAIKDALICIHTDGKDEDNALDDLKTLIESDFRRR
jgi:phosphocarrier protein